MTLITYLTYSPDKQTMYANYTTKPLPNFIAKKAIQNLAEVDGLMKLRRVDSVRHYHSPDYQLIQREYDSHHSTITLKTKKLMCFIAIGKLEDMCIALLGNTSTVHYDHQLKLSTH